MRARIDRPQVARLHRVRIPIATVYVMIRININVIMILWRYFIVSKSHTDILQSLTTGVFMIMHGHQVLFATPAITIRFIITF